MHQVGVSSEAITDLEKVSLSCTISYCTLLSELTKQMAYAHGGPICGDNYHKFLLPACFAYLVLKAYEDFSQLCVLSRRVRKVASGDCLHITR